MEIPSKIFLMKDSQGNKSFAVCEESCDTVFPQGLHGKDGESLYFEADAYHLPAFCLTHGIEIRCIDRNDDFDALWETANVLSPTKNSFPIGGIHHKEGGEYIVNRNN